MIRNKTRINIKKNPGFTKALIEKLMEDMFLLNKKLWLIKMRPDELTEIFKMDRKQIQRYEMPSMMEAESKMMTIVDELSRTN